MDEFDLRLLARLPLAQAVLETFDHVLDDGLCGAPFDEHRGRCYQDRLTFATLVRVLRDALVLHGGSANRAIGEAVAGGRLGAAPGGVYRKLGNLPLALSRALLARGTARLAPPMAGPAARVLPACFDGPDVVAVDGKKLKRAAKRLLPARAYTSGSLPGGKLLVALSVRSGLAVAMNASEDGERNDVPLVAGLLAQLAALRDAAAAAAAERRPSLFVADRQFADLGLPALFTRDGDHFLLRCGKALRFFPDPQRPARAGVDERGRSFTQEWGWIGGPEDARRRYVRRLTLARPEEEDDLVLITDLLDGAPYPAADLLALYRPRWTIEEAFQQVTEVFALARLIGATPRGIVFQGALCLLIYNLTLTVKSHVAGAGRVAMADVSTENVFYDLTREPVAWSVLGGGGGGGGGVVDVDVGVVGISDGGVASPPPALPPPAPRDAAAMRARLHELLGGLWRPRWVKRRDKRPRKPKPRNPLPGGHASLWKLMQAAGHRQTRVM